MGASFMGAAGCSYAEQNKSVQGLRISIQYTAAITTAQLISCQLNVQLIRDGQTTAIMAGPLYALALASDPTQIEGTTLQFTDDYVCGLNINFGQIINLKGSDKLQISLTGGTLPSLASTLVTTEYGIGVETYTPSVICFPVDKQRSSYDLPAMNDVNLITLIDTGASGAAGKMLFTGATLNSDKFELQATRNDLITMIAEQWDTAPTRNAFHLYAGPELDGAKLTFNIDTTATGAGFVVVFSGEVTPTVTKRSLNLINKIEKANLNKLTGQNQ